MSDTKLAGAEAAAGTEVAGKEWADDQLASAGRGTGVPAGWEKGLACGARRAPAAVGSEPINTSILCCGAARSASAQLIRCRRLPARTHAAEQREKREPVGAQTRPAMQSD